MIAYERVESMKAEEEGSKDKDKHKNSKVKECKGIEKAHVAELPPETLE